MYTVITITDPKLTAEKLNDLLDSQISLIEEKGGTVQVNNKEDKEDEEINVNNYKGYIKRKPMANLIKKENVTFYLFLSFEISNRHKINEIRHSLALRKEVRNVFIIKDEDQKNLRALKDSQAYTQVRTSNY